MNCVYSDENAMKSQLVEWLGSAGFTVKRGVRIGRLELDVVAVGSLLITRNGVKRARENSVYVFEAKIATSRRLQRDLVEQAIVRLLMADYVYVVVPKRAEVWVDEKTRTLIEPPSILGRIMWGCYSTIVGILAMEPSKPVEVVREARRSSLVLQELKKQVVQRVVSAGFIDAQYKTI